MMDESIERARCEELAKSSSFYRKVYSEVSHCSSMGLLIARKLNFWGDDE